MTKTTTIDGTLINDHLRKIHRAEYNLSQADNALRQIADTPCANEDDAEDLGFCCAHIFGDKAADICPWPDSAMSEAFYVGMSLAMVPASNEPAPVRIDRPSVMPTFLNTKPHQRLHSDGSVRRHADATAILVAPLALVSMAVLIYATTF